MSNRRGKSSRFREGHHYLVDPETGCWHWQLFKYRGYGTTQPGGYVHRLTYQEMVGPIPDGHHLHHLCPSKDCINPAHLTPLLPSVHLAMHARARLSPLTVEKVRELRERAIAGEPLPDLAREYGVTRQTAGDVARGDVWASAPGPIGRPETFCLVCGKPLTGRRHRKYCSNAHRTTGNARKARARLKAAA